jgi:predicted RNA-binding Zn-ribbon protein involved in translation (DUF1610 family)
MPQKVMSICPKSRKARKMDIELGKRGLGLSWQDDFPEKTKCNRCSLYAKIAFVVMEHNEDKYVSSLRENGDSIWPHDAIAVAVYICPKCGEAIARWNQA